MTTTILLVIIYIAFISLGLPDAIMGSAWPEIHKDLAVPVSYAGVFTMIVSGGTIISSLLSERVIRKLKTGKVTAISVMLTAIGLLGIYIAPSYWWICLLGIPLGLGAGAVDAALNNFVALHYEAKHMSWLHCFWGVGATTGPILMSVFMQRDAGWRMGYLIIGLLQVVLVICLFAAIPLWKRFEKETVEETGQKQPVAIGTLLRLKGAKPALISFFCYCAVELTVGLWGATYLVIQKGLSTEVAAKWISFYYLGITLGRFLTGFIAMRMANKNLIRLGQILCIFGVMLLFMPFTNYFQLIGLVLIGLGLAPIYPAMLHETPNRFGKELSQGFIGIQMAVAYVGSTFVPPLFGMIGKARGFYLFPWFAMGIVVLMLFTSELVRHTYNNKQRA